MTNKILHLTEATLKEGFVVHVSFDDGMRKTVDLLPLLSGPVFERLRDPDEFRQFRIDPIAGTICWSNGADLAPEALRDLPAVVDEP